MGAPPAARPSPSLQGAVPSESPAAPATRDVAHFSGCHFKLGAEWLVIIQEPGQKINQALQLESCRWLRLRVGLGLPRGERCLQGLRLCRAQLGVPSTPFFPAEQPWVGVQPPQLLCCSCRGQVARDGDRAGAGARARGGDYGQAETMAIRESGLHLAPLRVWLSNSCFNQWNCKILQLP